MRNRLRAIAFDVLAPLAAIAGLVYIGLALAWPVWWVAVCSVLCLLIVQAVIVDFVLYRRDGVTVGTDDEGPGLRLAVVGLAAVALVAAVAVGYTRWTVPERTMHDDMAAVVGIASSVAEASATFTPQDPNASIDRATGLMTPERADAYRNEFASVAKELAQQEHLRRRRARSPRASKPSGRPRPAWPWSCGARRTRRASRPTSLCWRCGSP